MSTIGAITLHLNNFLSKYKFGFKEKINTYDAVYHLIEQAGASAIVFYDLSNAFDYVSHEILLWKLNRCDFRGVALSWFSSFLRGASPTCLHRAYTKL